MKKVNFKYIFIVILFVVATGVSWNLYFKVYMQKDSVNIHLFPKSIGEWASKELTITDDEYDILETRNAFSRKYTTSSGKSVSLFTVYSENNRKVSHPPEICYTGGGASILKNSHDTIEGTTLDDTIQANKLFLEQGNLQQVVFYWFKVGDVFTSNYWKQQLMIAINPLLGQSSSSALIRLSTVVQNGDLQQAEENIKEFGNLIIPELNKYLP